MLTAGDTVRKDLLRKLEEWGNGHSYLWRPAWGAGSTAPHLDGGSHEGEASWRRWHIN